MKPDQQIKIRYVADPSAQATAQADQLEQCDGRFEVDAVDSETAQRRPTTQGIDCVVVSGVDSDGLALLEQLRESSPTLPIILQDSRFGDPAAALDAGATGVVPETDTDQCQVLAGRISDAVLARRAAGGRERQQLERLQEMTRELMDAPAGAIRTNAVSFASDVLDLPVTALALQQDGALTVVAATDEAAELFGQLPSFNDTAGLIQQTFERGEPIVVGDAREHPDVADSQTPVRSVGVFPLGEHGVLTTGSTEPDVLDDTDANFGTLLAASVESALDRAEREQHLQRQNERLEEFASVVSHDLQSPLNVAKGYLELLQGQYDDETLDRIADAHDRMEELIEGVLALARQGETVGDTEPTEVTRVAREAWETTAETQASLEVADPGVVAADPERLRQLLENLFRNAIEHAGPEVTVTVGAEAKGGFYVADDGPGLEEPEHVFERGHSSSESGSGFGLAIVREIAAAHGWSVAAGESKDGGARFDIASVDSVSVGSQQAPRNG